MFFGTNFFALLSILFWTVHPIAIPNLELGRYEYAGIDNKKFHFFRVENEGTYREVEARTTGIGEIQYLPFCDKDQFGTTFYDCGQYPDLEKPYIEFSANGVELALFYGPSEAIQVVSGSYSIQGDTLSFGEAPVGLKVACPKGNKNREIGLPYRIYQTSRSMVSSVDLYADYLSEQEHLDQIRAQSKLSVGDTIALCLLKERFVKR
ncbi:MAG: hypothetical protein SFV55_10795 [Haliscomenobacter sp.]|uniref:hypothetical protein n=1 Tax=Haliscomenobacter sp. TaxID=2717303 RepID=UPI0029B73558|nr:hypothetical protein [Haliscomenobacter sp.]MDX2068905.1 hypothetical protein [Haliscomenobacter sp.]